MKRSRRNFLGQALTATGTAIAAPAILNQATNVQEKWSAKTAAPGEMAVTLKVNAQERSLTLEPRVTLLDTLRERLELVGSKKGCDHGQCGACTVLIDGQRVYSCLALAVMQEGKEIVTVEGLAKGDTLHPVQTAFGFGSFNTARRTLNGYEIMNMIRKGQVEKVRRGAVRERVKFIAEIFGVAA